MKTKALDKKDAEPKPQPVVKIVKDNELQQSTIQAMEDLRAERDKERSKSDLYKKQLSELEIQSRMVESRLNSQEKVQKALHGTINELEKEVSIYKEKLRSTKEKLVASEDHITNDKRKMLALENELYEQQARRERAEREAARLDEHNRDLDDTAEKEKAMRISAERRANRNDQFHELWKGNRGAQAPNTHPSGARYDNNISNELKAYRRLTDDLNSQLSSETNLRRHIEKRLRRPDGYSGSTPRLNFIRGGWWKL